MFVPNEWQHWVSVTSYFSAHSLCGCKRVNCCLPGKRLNYYLYRSMPLKLKFVSKLQKLKFTSHSKYEKKLKITTYLSEYCKLLC